MKQTIMIAIKHGASFEICTLQEYANKYEHLWVEFVNNSEYFTKNAQNIPHDWADYIRKTHGTDVEIIKILRQSNDLTPLPVSEIPFGQLKNIVQKDYEIRLTEFETTIGELIMFAHELYLTGTPCCCMDDEYEYTDEETGGYYYHEPRENGHWSGTLDEMILYNGVDIDDPRKTCLSLSRNYGSTPYLNDDERKIVMGYLWPDGNPRGGWFNWFELESKLRTFQKDFFM